MAVTSAGEKKSAPSSPMKADSRVEKDSKVSDNKKTDAGTTGFDKKDRFDSSPLSQVSGKGPEEPAAPPARTKEQAAKDAETLLRGAETSDPSAPNGATIVRDAADVNDVADTDPNSQRYQDAKAQVEANRALEKEKLATMSPQDQEKYQQVQKELQAANDPVAELALQKLLFEDKLPGAKDVKGQGTTLDNLATLANPCTQLADGLDRGKLLSDVVQELATPDAIAQHTKNTCGPTAASIYLAMNNPAEYVRLATGLASPSGQVELANGATLQRVDNTIADDGSGRSTSQRLMEPALMDYANGPLGYDNARDVHTIGGIGTVPGALPFMMEPVLEAVTGQQFDSIDLVYPWARTQVMDNIKALTDQGKQAMVMTQYTDAGMQGLHWITVTNVTDDQVTYVNPWGREETISRQQFEDMLRGYVTPQDTGAQASGSGAAQADAIAAARRAQIAA